MNPPSLADCMVLNQTNRFMNKKEEKLKITSDFEEVIKLAVQPPKEKKISAKKKKSNKRNINLQ